MVRLKVKAVTVVTLGYTISIPYGAIKSIQECESWDSIKSEFQFLMVRLKVCPEYTFLYFSTKFQFLMVRLKAVAIAF